MRTNAPLPNLAGDALRIQVTAVLKDNFLFTAFDYLCPTPAMTPAATAAAIAGLFVTAFNSTLTACVSQEVTFDLVNAIYLSRNDIITQVNTTLQGVPGAAASDSHPSIVATIISKLTDVRGQHGRGRNFMFGVPLSFVTPSTDPNQLNAAALTTYNAFYSLWTSTVFSTGGGTWVPALTSRPLPDEAVTLRGAPVTSYVTRNFLGTQRRRRFGRGI